MMALCSYVFAVGLASDAEVYILLSITVAALIGCAWHIRCADYWHRMYLEIKDKHSETNGRDNLCEWTGEQAPVERCPCATCWEKIKEESRDQD